MNLFLHEMFGAGRRERSKYYKNRHFRDVDRVLRGAYRFINPYRLVKAYREERGESDPYCYGETPLSVYEEIGKACHLGEDDIFLELGCGRGRGCFFMAHFFHCRALGIDCVPEFIETAEALVDTFHMPNVLFRCEDMFTADYRGASCIYLYGTCMSDAEIARLEERFSTMPSGTQIVSVSAPLSFPIVKKWEARYPWGETEVFVHHV